MDEETLRAGLMMERAEAYQRMAEASLERLEAHTAGLDAVVRDEIRRTLLEELRGVNAESKRAVAALRHVKRAASVRALLWSAGMMLLCVATTGGVIYWLLPSRAEIAALRSQREALAANLVSLQRQGGRVDLRRCGDGRLCVRVERKGPSYGDQADYLVVKGY